MEREYSFPVWGTQGGGLVRVVGETYIFVTKPAEGTGLDVGDEMPEEWGLIPANDLARQVDEQFDPSLPARLSTAEMMELFEVAHAIDKEPPELRPEL